MRTFLNAVFVGLLIFGFANVGTLTAAPPDVKFLYPAGGKTGETVTVTVSGNLGSDGTQIWTSGNGLQAKLTEEKGKIAVTIAAEARPGVHWLRFYNAEGATSLRPFVVGTLPEVIEKEPNDRLRQAQSLDTSMVVINGTLGKTGDADAYAIPLTQGQTLVVSMSAHQTLGSPMDGILQLVSPAGFVLEQNDDAHGFDPQLVFTAPRAGTYFIRAFGFPAAPNSSIRLAGGSDYVYRITATTGPFVDHVFPMAVTREKTTHVRPVGWNIPDELKQVPINLNPTDATAGVHHPKLANATRVSIVRHPVSVADEPNDLDHPRKITLPMTITGRIDEPHDVDTFLFQAKKGDKLVFRVESRKLGYPLDPVLKLLDATGKVLREVDDPSRGVYDSVLTQTIPADGKYRLSISDLFQHGGLRYVYRLTAELQQPDYSLTLAGDTFKLTPGKPLEIPVTVSRKNGFAAEIEFVIPDLPEGLTLEPAKSLPKGETAKKVKLILKAAAGVTFNGPLRIGGTSAGETPLKRDAMAPIAGVTEKTRSVWLTVLKPAVKE